MIRYEDIDLLRTMFPIVGDWSWGSRYGWRVHPIQKVLKFHNGEDIKAPSYTPLVTLVDNTTLHFGEDGTNGKYCIMSHPEYGAWWYLHMQTQNSKLEGATVPWGTQVGTVGSTGASTGPHLHLIWFDSANPPPRGRDPRPLLEAILRVQVEKQLGRLSIDGPLPSIDAVVNELIGDDEMPAKRFYMADDPEANQLFVMGGVVRKIGNPETIPALKLLGIVDMGQADDELIAIGVNEPETIKGMKATFPEIVGLVYGD